MFELSGGRPGRSGWRSLTGVSASVALHVAVGFGAVALINIVPAKPPRLVNSALTFIAARPMPVIPSESIRQPLQMPPAVVELRAPVPVELPENLVAPTVETKHPEVQAQLPNPLPRQPVIPETPKPAPQVTVGAFADSPAPARTAYVNHQVDVAGFDAPAAQGAQSKTRDMAVGSFDTPANNAKPGTDRPVGTLVADAGFGRATVASAQPASNRTLGDSGFAGTGAPQTKAAGNPAREVIQSGFSDAQVTSSSAAKPTAPVERIEIPMEVLSKPAPVYTAEARDLKLEGEVSLEVEFCATGSVRVLRVLRGLGHGLDEAAANAAQRIQFKPAQSHGKAVDFRTTVHITFRLT